MGCGASKRTTVAPVEELGSDDDSPSHQLHIRRSSGITAQNDDHSMDVLKDGNSRSSGTKAQAMAFEVPVNDESIIRKHPPKRFQKLEDQQITLTHEFLDGKQAEAEQRRIQILTQRIQSAKRSIPRRPFLIPDSESPTDMMETMKRENSTLEL